MAAADERPDPPEKEAAGSVVNGTESQVAESQGKEAEIPSIAEAKALVEEMKKQNKLLMDSLKKAERISAETILSGRSPAGREITKDEQEIAYARKMLAGTGYDEQLFPRGKPIHN